MTIKRRQLLATEEREPKKSCKTAFCASRREFSRGLPVNARVYPLSSLWRPRCLAHL